MRQESTRVTHERSTITAFEAAHVGRSLVLRAPTHEDRVNGAGSSVAGGAPDPFSRHVGTEGTLLQARATHGGACQAPYLDDPPFRVMTDQVFPVLRDWRRG